MRQYIDPTYKEVTPSNHRLAHNPTALFVKIMHQQFKTCVMLRKRRSNG